MTKSSKLEYTAYLTSCERTMFPDLSADRFAHHWIPIETWQILSDFLKCRNSSPQIIAARNRLFFEAAQNFLKQENATFLNLAAGMSSYPYLLDENILTIEVDSENMIVKKKAIREKLEGTKKLPQRQIEYYNFDLLQDTSPLFENIHARKKGHKIFILLEGISYYLTKEAINNILANITKFLSDDCLIQVGIIFWDNSVRDHLFLRDYKNFINNESHHSFDFLFLEKNDFLTLLPNHQCLSYGMTRDLVSQYGYEVLVPPCFTEHYIIMG